MPTSALYPTIEQMAGKRKAISGEQRDQIANRIYRNTDLSTRAEVRGETARAEELLNENTQLLAQLPETDRTAIERRALVHLQLSNHAVSVKLEALARRKLINLVDDFTWALGALAPKRRITRGTPAKPAWEYVDDADGAVEAEIWKYMRRRGLMDVLNAKRDRELAAHWARLEGLSDNEFEDVIDEIGREREERADAELEPDDVEWMEGRLRAEGATSAARSKDVAQALNRSESWLRVRKLRQKQTTVTKRSRKKR
jgi:hypothetical protein